MQATHCAMGCTMQGEVLAETVVELSGRKYTVYLKEVATRLGEHGNPRSTMIKAFVRGGEKRGQSTLH